MGDSPEVYKNRMERLALKVLGVRRKEPALDSDSDLVEVMNKAIHREIEIGAKGE